MSQKNIFLDTEGDAWFDRCHKNSLNRDFDKVDPVVAALKKLGSSYDSKETVIKILEIGCGGAKRLEWLKDNLNFDVYGIDPSKNAIDQALEYGVHAKKGTADNIPFLSNQFDIVIFGFCLYLCDKDDLFQIAAEANRVLKSESWIIIHDFFATAEKVRDYKHKKGVYVRKMDYRSLFTWHPDFVCYSHTVNSHSSTHFTDDADEWISTSVIRKVVTVE